MSESTAELTAKYILEHHDIKSCLKKDLINYSSLARLIAKELKVEKKTSMEAILVAARRFSQKLEKEVQNDNKIRELLKNSELEIKNKISVFVLDKDIDVERVGSLQTVVKKEKGTFYLIEGSHTYTLIVQEKYDEKVKKLFVAHVVKENKNLALITFKTPKEIENTIGTISYLTALFSENNVNIVELLSCWTDTLFVVDAADVPKTMSFLKF